MGQTITKVIYCEQLDRLKTAISEKRPFLLNRKGVILQHDNASSHTAKVTLQKIRELGWEVIPHPAYSPDIAPSDYYLFRSLEHFLRGKKYKDMDDIKIGLLEFFGQKTPSWYEEGIKDLLNRWTHIVDNDGNYIID
jgi:[histone H3]-lysine36 N-dimethyltransferase SETMAR